MLDEVQDEEKGGKKMEKKIRKKNRPRRSTGTIVEFEPSSKDRKVHFHTLMRYLGTCLVRDLVI